MLNLVLQGLLLVGLLVLGGSLGIWANRVLPAWVTPALAGVAVVVGILSTIRLGGKDRWLEMVARWADALIGKNPLFGATAAVLMLAIAVGLLLDIKRRSDADELKPNFAFQIHAAHRPLANVEVSAKPVGQDEAQATTARTDGDGVAQMRLAIDVANLIRVIRMMNGERRSANLDPPQVGKAQMQSIDYDLTLITAEQWSPLGQEVPLNFAQFPPRVVSAQPLSVTPHERVAAYAPWGLPGAERILVRRFSVLGYDLRWRAPVWVAFKLDEQRAGPNVDRSWRDSFRVDADLPTDAQPQRKDFVRSGYDIGSLIRRTDARIAGPDAIREYFLLSSVVPRHRQVIG